MAQSLIQEGNAASNLRAQDHESTGARDHTARAPLASSPVETISILIGTTFLMTRRSTLVTLSITAGLLSCSAPRPARVPAPPDRPVVPVPVRVITGVPDTLHEVPSMPREARGVWIASVSNLDWPSKPGLSADSQKAELRTLLDYVKHLRMNLVILQVRPAGDALYPSSLEPWSEYLTGTQGKGPYPFYDPLAFAIEEAHARGLELHAWFNPYRARHPSAKSEPAPTHLSRTRPDLVRKYGSHLWMDPGEAEVQEHTLRVVLDVVRRYNVDGVHLDDYFYPYLEDDPVTRKPIDFPDAPSWSRYVAAGGTLSRHDWRRSNVDKLVQRLHAGIRATKPWVKFGISPFGIWRPGYPASVQGLDAYVELYADSRKWLNNGWVDYFAPQLYWRSDSPQQGYADLVQWWVQENRQDRHIWIGNAAYRVRADRQNWPPEEITHQIALTRANRGASGNIQFNMRSLFRNQGGVADALQNTYAYDALMPRTPWLDNVPPPAPQVRLINDSIEIEPQGQERPLLYAVRMRFKDGWYSEAIPATRLRYIVARAGVMPELIGVTAVDRNGNESQAMLLRLTSASRS